MNVIEMVPHNRQIENKWYDTIKARQNAAKEQ
jgi:hypothetical protein